MSAGALRGFAVLAMEAIQDAVRRRIVAAIAAVSVLSLLWIDSCTSCAGGDVVINGQTTELASVAGWTGALTYGVLALWSLVLAGVLAAEHLAQTLSDGSAVLCLARPVGRTHFALARLVGALTIALVTAALLLGATAGLLNLRSGLPLGPALAGGLAFLGGAVTVSALAMWLSLFLARVAGVLVVFAFVGGVSLANGLALFGAAPGGVLGIIDRFGPPLASSLAVALSGWIPGIDMQLDAAGLVFRMVLWVGGSLVLLAVTFDRKELGQ